MRINLPEEVGFVCPGCGSRFRLEVRLIHNRRELTCPTCSTVFAVYDGFPANLKRKAYHALRDELEKCMYSKYREHHPESAAGWEGPRDTLASPED